MRVTVSANSGLGWVRLSWSTIAAVSASGGELESLRASPRRCFPGGETITTLTARPRTSAPSSVFRRRVQGDPFCARLFLRWFGLAERPVAAWPLAGAQPSHRRPVYHTPTATAIAAAITDPKSTYRALPVLSPPSVEAGRPPALPARPGSSSTPPTAAPATIGKGPTVTVLVQLPALSAVQMWKKYEPSAREALVTVIAGSSRSLVWSQVGVLVVLKTTA